MLLKSIKPVRARCVKRTYARHLGKFGFQRAGWGSYDEATNVALRRGGIIGRMRIYSALRFQAPVPSFPVITASASRISYAPPSL
jgi:hypothetical protein